MITKKTINPNAINKSEIARNLGFSSEYIRLLLTGKRTNPTALKKVHNEIRKQLKVE